LKHLKRYITLVCIIGALVAATSPLFAQENKTDKQQPTPPPAKEQTNKNEIEAKKNTNKDPSFNPSEDISEDLSVPFPVDI